MIAAPERSPERDAAIEAMLPNIGFDGWTLAALRHAGVEDADLLFPGGVADMIATFCDWADRRMEAAAGAMPDGMPLPARVKRVIALRLEQNRPWKEAVRRALALLSLPGNARLAAACTARTIDSIWHAAGDRSTDFSWYTKRFGLAAVYGATLLYWLRDASDDDAPTLAFLDRRLRGLAHRTRLPRKLTGMVRKLVPRRAA